jgi:hypothetical protein
MAANLDFSRRLFLRAAGLSVAGVAVGAGAAWAYGQTTDTEAARAALSQLQTQLATAQAEKTTLEGSFATLNQQVVTLDSQLAAATTQNAQLATALTDSQKEAEVLRTQLADLQARLTGAEGKLTEYKDLIGLYDQLEGVGLDALAQNGLQTAAAGLTSALGLMPLVQSGLQSARGLLDDFEKVLPDFHDGLAWLSDQIINLKLGLFAVEKAAQTTLTHAATGVVAVFGGFITFVLDYLPFDIGKQTRATFDGAQSLITQTSGMTAQTDERVFNKMSRYVSGGPNSWQTKLVAPLREQTLAPAEKLLSAVNEAQTTFSATLANPVQSALEQRASLRQKISEHRAAHGL